MGDYSPQDMKKSIGKTINTKRMLTAPDVEKVKGSATIRQYVFLNLPLTAVESLPEHRNIKGVGKKTRSILIQEITKNQKYTRPAAEVAQAALA